MKFVFSFIQITIILFYSQHAYCQVNSDSAIAWTVKLMQSQLQLSSGQTTSVLELIKKHRGSADSLGRNKVLNIEDRGKELEKMQTRFEKLLKDELSNNQWKQYKNIQAENRTDLLKRLKDKKIPVKELPYDPG